MENPSNLFSVGSNTLKKLCRAIIEKTEHRNEKSLYRRLSALGTSGGSVSKICNQYLREGKPITKYELGSCIKELRKYKRYQHAIEVIEWMKMRGINLSYSDYAIHLDLLAKTKGITSAESYFDSLSESAKNQLAYGALLNSYCREKMVDKSLDLFEKMNELNFVTNSFAYNNLMIMYMKLGEPEKIPPLVLEMKKKNISPNAYTYNNLMTYYASFKDIEGVERVMEEINTEGGDNKCNWTTYSYLATIYIEAGLLEKADLALKKLEGKMKPHDRMAYHTLISLYAQTSNVEAVKRVWSNLKSALPRTVNSSYLVMLQALARLDDFEGVKNCFKEWESGCSIYNMRLTNVLVSVYLRRDMIKEAELLCDSATKRGVESDFRTWELFMDFFLRTSRMDSALGFMEMAVSKAKNREWKPDKERVSAFMKYFEEEGDVKGAEEFCKMLKKVNGLDSHAYHLLLKTYIAAGKIEPEMGQRMDEDEIEMTSEIKSLLDKVCPE